MASSRKSQSPIDCSDLFAAFERALGNILARVSVCAERPAVAIAYSGGLDSAVLLYLAKEYAKKHGLRLYAFHIHHGLSPNADSWLEHCRQQSARYAIPFQAAKVRLQHTESTGIEEAARIARYAELGRLCRSHQASVLLTAHHQDDQAETVLLQMMRGAGLPGLSGMPELSLPHELLGTDVALGRPLLSVSRKTLEQAAQHLNVLHVTDESNMDVRYRRNAVRREIAPVIEAHFPGFAARVARSATHIQGAQSLLQELAMLDLSACRSADDANALDLRSMQRLSSQRIDNLLRYWLASQGLRLPPMMQLEEMRVQIFQAAADTHPLFELGGYQLRRDSCHLRLYQAMRNEPPEEPLLLQWRGEPCLSIPAWKGRLVFRQVEGAGLNAKQLYSAPLLLQPRSGRERLKLDPNRPSRTLKNLFQETGIPSWRRGWLPVVYLDSVLVFVAELGMDVRSLNSAPGVLLHWESSV